MSDGRARGVRDEGVRDAIIRAASVAAANRRHILGLSALAKLGDADIILVAEYSVSAPPGQRNLDLSVKVRAEMAAAFMVSSRGGPEFAESFAQVLGRYDPARETPLVIVDEASGVAEEALVLELPWAPAAGGGGGGSPPLPAGPPPYPGR